MEEIIAKKYVKALQESFDLESLKKVNELFLVLAQAYKDEKFLTIINSPDISQSKKEEFILDLVSSAGSDKINNFIKLIIEKRRIGLIVALSSTLEKHLNDVSKIYTGTVYSDSEINDDVLKQLSEGLSKKFDANIALKFVQNEFNGVKVDVDSLGIEINFSKDRIDSKIIEHIIKAI